MIRKSMMRMTFIFISAAAFLTGGANAQEPVFDVALVAPPTDEKVQWHGYYEFEYWDRENAKNTFDTHKITVWMGIKLSDKAFLASEVEYEHAPGLGSGEINLDSAQLRLTPIDKTTLYMGAFYVPFGIEYFSYPGHKNKLVTRPKAFKSGGIIPGTWSDVGLGINQVFSGIGQADFYYINGDAYGGGISRDDKSGGNDAKSAGARLMIDGLIDGFNAGFSVVTGEWDENSEYESTRYGAHIRMDSDRIFGAPWAPVLIAEYVTGTDKAASAVEGADRDVEGFYAQASSMIVNGIEVVARYGEYDNDKEAQDNKRTETSAGVVWHALENVQVKAEYQWNTEEGEEIDNNAAAVQVVAHW